MLEHVQRTRRNARVAKTAAVVVLALALGSTGLAVLPLLHANQQRLAAVAADMSATQERNDSADAAAQAAQDELTARDTMFAAIRQNAVEHDTAVRQEVADGIIPAGTLPGTVGYDAHLAAVNDEKNNQAGETYAAAKDRTKQAKAAADDAQTSKDLADIDDQNAVDAVQAATVRLMITGVVGALALILAVIVAFGFSMNASKTRAMAQAWSRPTS